MQIVSVVDEPPSLGEGLVDGGLARELEVNVVILALPGRRKVPRVNVLPEVALAVDLDDRGGAVIARLTVLSGEGAALGRNPLALEDDAPAFATTETGDRADAHRDLIHRRNVRPRLYDEVGEALLDSRRHWILAVVGGRFRFVEPLMNVVHFV